jgi:hypothetical protein
LEDAIFYEFEIDEDGNPVDAVSDFDESKDSTDCTVTTVDTLTPMCEIRKSSILGETKDATAGPISPLVSIHV